MTRAPLVLTIYSVIVLGAGGRAVVIRVPVFSVVIDVANSWQPMTLCWVAGRGIIIFFRLHSSSLDGLDDVKLPEGLV